MTLAGAPRSVSFSLGPVSSPAPAPLEVSLQEALVVIPARLASTRFPRKVLARDTGKYLIEHVWEGVRGAPGVARVIIATDSREVLEAAEAFGAEARLTSPSHPSGTDRVAEVARDLPYPIIVNVQGDEPLIQGEDVARIIGLFGAGDGAAAMTTLAMERHDPDGHADPNNVKVVLDSRGRALYFSRAPIPTMGPAGGTWLHHVGIYGYRREYLLRFASLKPGTLETVERLEQLRALENGFVIQVGITPHRYRGIDTVEEYLEFARALAARAVPPRPGALPPRRGAERGGGRGAERGSGS